MNNKSLLDPSLKGLWKLCYPLMLGFLSTSMMMFADRLFLAHYSPLAMTALATAINSTWAILTAWTTMATMAEVFVAQYNGARQYSFLGRPIWQMIYLALFSIVFFIPVALWGADWICGGKYATPEEISYVSPMLLFGPFYVLLFGLTAFFIGQGKTKIINYSSVGANILNIILAYLFIFGCDPFIPEMGITGAALATGITITIESFFLLFLFLSSKNRASFRTNDYTLDLTLLWKILKIGAAPALLISLEIGCWSLFYKIISTISPYHILVASIAQSALFLFIFFAWGLEKGCAAIAGNLIGAKKLEGLIPLVSSAFKISALAWVFLVGLTFAFSDKMFHLFTHPSVNETHFVDFILEPSFIQYDIFLALLCMSAYLFFENMRASLTGILTAAGDTFFLMIVGVANLGCFLILPTYLFAKNYAPWFSVCIATIYCFIAMTLLFFRLHSKGLKVKSFVESS